MRIVILIAGLMSVCCFARSQGTLIVVVDNIKEVQGEIHVGLFSNEKDFPDKATSGKIIKVIGTTVQVLFEKIENGNYAISVFHDANSNGNLDTNFIGIPKEGFVFGNNAMGTFGPPSFDKAKITLENNTVRQVLTLKYF